MNHQRFIFDSYLFDAEKRELRLSYLMDDSMVFNETYRFDFEYAEYDPAVLDQALQNLFLMAGVSYYKTYLPPVLDLGGIRLDHETARFFSKTYQRGLGEFFYVNGLDPRTEINFPAEADGVGGRLSHGGNGALIGLGGGKDSLVSVELLRGAPRTATWSAGHRPQLTPLVERIGLTHLWVEREWDRQLLELNQKGAYNGHVPISAILAAAGTVAAVLGGYRDVVVSNEHSANEPTLTYQGMPINHQYSKSLEFERDYQALLDRQFGGSLRYYSLLRPLSELRISELFTETGLDKYRGVFSSCNKTFRHDSDTMTWCGQCPKCAFVFLALTPFVDRQELEDLFGGRNLLLDPALEPTYRQLLGIEGDKPLECVGEIMESRIAMHRAQSRYPELIKYRFELPRTADYRSLADHAMPPEEFAVLKSALDKLDD